MHYAFNRKQPKAYSLKSLNKVSELFRRGIAPFILFIWSYLGDELIHWYYPFCWWHIVDKGNNPDPLQSPAHFLCSNEISLLSLGGLWLTMRWSFLLCPCYTFTLNRYSWPNLCSNTSSTTYRSIHSSSNKASTKSKGRVVPPLNFIPQASGLEGRTIIAKVLWASMTMSP